MGAFAAGVVLEEVHYKPFLERGERRVQDPSFADHDLGGVYFFRRHGFPRRSQQFRLTFRVEVRSDDHASGHCRKKPCGLGVLERGVDRLAIGVGMIPRGEVGLIFAGLGSRLMLQGHPLLSSTTFSALVLMIVLTTFITPPLLKFVFDRK